MMASICLRVLANLFVFAQKRDCNQAINQQRNAGDSDDDGDNLVTQAWRKRFAGEPARPMQVLLRQ